MGKSKSPERERGQWPVGSVLQLYVAGVEPVPKGNMRAFVPKGWSRAVITDGKGKELRAYAEHMRDAARQEMDRRSLPCGHQQPFEVVLGFFVARPGGDFDKHGMLRGPARATPWVKPDIDKLARATLDSLTSLVWDDDSRIVRLVVEKRFADAKHDLGTFVQVRLLPRTVLDEQLARQRNIEVTT